MSYDLLSEPIRRYVRDKRWDALRPIQAAAITRILSTEDNYILASRTASGKTEAAFLPILSKVDFSERGVQVLYISPLIALINDQFGRVEELCKYMDIAVTKWHGEASKAAKDKLLKYPSGIMLITPESIEAMLTNHPYNAKALFSALKFVVIDEIHSFLGTDRGLHLKSLLHRVKRLNTVRSARVIALSATIGDYDEAKRFTGDPDNTKVLLDKTAKEIDAQFRFIKTEGVFSSAFFEELYEKTKDSKALIFPNSRGRVEEIAVGLKKVAARKGGHAFYFSHHSSIDRELREYIETFAKNNKHQPFCIVCTSTLELGIDIGSVDIVVQIDAAHSIASLIQRIGRSGRRDGAKSALLLYATSAWSLLQSYACWELYLSGFIEPVTARGQPFDLLFHQTLSLLKETSGLAKEELLKRLQENPALTTIPYEAKADLIRFMIEADYAEDLEREIIVGLEGEKLTSSRDFYSMFSTPEMYTVLHSGKQIGELPISPLVQTGENVLLAASIWKIIDVDDKSKKIFVARASDGKSPLFFGEGGAVHARIRQKMLELLYSDYISEWSDDAAKDAIAELRRKFQSIPIEDIEAERPYIQKEKSVELYTFTSTQIDDTIEFLLRRLGIESRNGEVQTALHPNELMQKLAKELFVFDTHLKSAFTENADYFPQSKWGQYLPLQLKELYAVQNFFDLQGTAEYLNRTNFIAEASV